MAHSKFRRAIGSFKDQTSISIAKVANQTDPELEILIVKATSHDEEIPNPKYLKDIISKASLSNTHVKSCIHVLSKRIAKTHDWVVALKSLVLVHGLLLNDGSDIFMQEINNANKESCGFLSKMCYFKGEKEKGVSSICGYYEFVRRFGMFLDEKVDLMGFDQMWVRRRRDKEVEKMIHFSEMSTERVLNKMEQFQWLLDRVLSCKPRGVAGKHKLVVLALGHVVEESVVLYNDVSEGLLVFLDRFRSMSYRNSAEVYGIYATVATQLDELDQFYTWCKGVGVAPQVVYPKVDKVSDDLLRSLEKKLKEKDEKLKSLVNVRGKFGNLMRENGRDDVGAVRLSSPMPESCVSNPDMAVTKGQPNDGNESTVDDLENSEIGTAMAKVSSETTEFACFVEENQLDDLSLEGREETFLMSCQRATPQVHFSNAENLSMPILMEGSDSLKEVEASGEQLHKNLASSMFCDSQGVMASSAWEDFRECTESHVTSARQTPSTSSDHADWEKALDESANNLRHIAELSGSYDALLNGALPAPAVSECEISALPSVGGLVSTVNQDPYAASSSMPPHQFVQMQEEREKKHQFMMQEQMLWEQYMRDQGSDWRNYHYL